MNFEPDKTLWLPDGEHKRGSLSMFFVGPETVDTSWAVNIATLQTPTNAHLSVGCIPHQDPDRACNLAIEMYLRIPKEERFEWLALIPAGTYLEPTALVRMLFEDAPSKVRRCGAALCIHTSALEGAEPPWYRQLRATAHDMTETCSASSVRPTKDEKQSLTLDPEAAEKTCMVLVPTFGKCSLMWASHVCGLAPPVASQFGIMLAKGHEVGDARNLLVKKVEQMEVKPKYVLFLGDDMVAPPTGLRYLYQTMHETGAKAVAGLYYIKANYPPTALMWRDDKPGVMEAGKDFQVGDVVPVHGTGLDFVLFETEALLAVPSPRFKTVQYIDDKEGYVQMTEDSWFWKRWKQTHDSQPLVHTGCRIAHYNTIDGGFY